MHSITESLEATQPTVPAAIPIRLRKTDEGFQIIEGRQLLMAALRKEDSTLVNAGEFGDYSVIKRPFFKLVLAKKGVEFPLSGVENFSLDCFYPAGSVF